MPEHSSRVTWATSVAVGYAYHAGPYGHVRSEQSAARQPSSQPQAKVSSSQTPWPLHGMSPCVFYQSVTRRRRKTDTENKPDSP